MLLLTDLLTSMWLCPSPPPKKKGDHLSPYQKKWKWPALHKIHPHNIMVLRSSWQDIHHLYSSTSLGDKHTICVYQLLAFKLPDMVRRCMAPSWMPSHINQKTCVKQKHFSYRWTGNPSSRLVDSWYLSSVSIIGPWDPGSLALVKSHSHLQILFPVTPATSVFINVCFSVCMCICTCVCVCVHTCTHACMWGQQKV